MTSHILPTEELTRLVASSKAEDHRKLAKHYAAHAADRESDAKAHEALAKQYEKTSPALAAAGRRDRSARLPGAALGGSRPGTPPRPRSSPAF